VKDCKNTLDKNSKALGSLDSRLQFLFFDCSPRKTNTDRFLCRTHVTMLETLQAANANVTALMRKLGASEASSDSVRVQLDGGRVHTVQSVYRPLLTALAFGAEPKKVAVAFAGLTDPLDASKCDLLTAALQHRFKGELALAEKKSSLLWQPEKQPAKSKQLVTDIGQTLPVLVNELQHSSPTMVSVVSMIMDKKFNPFPRGVDDDDSGGSDTQTGTDTDADDAKDADEVHSFDDSLLGEEHLRGFVKRLNSRVNRPKQRLYRLGTILGLLMFQRNKSMSLIASYFGITLAGGHLSVPVRTLMNAFGLATAVQTVDKHVALLSANPHSEYNFHQQALTKYLSEKAMEIPTPLAAPPPPPPPPPPLPADLSFGSASGFGSNSGSRSGSGSDSGSGSHSSGSGSGSGSGSRSGSRSGSDSGSGSPLTAPPPPPPPPSPADFGSGSGSRSGSGSGSRSGSGSYGTEMAAAKALSLREYNRFLGFSWAEDDASQTIRSLGASMFSPAEDGNCGPAVCAMFEHGTDPMLVRDEVMDYARQLTELELSSITDGVISTYESLILWIEKFKSIADVNEPPEYVCVEFMRLFASSKFLVVLLKGENEGCCDIMVVDCHAWTTYQHRNITFGALRRFSGKVFLTAHIKGIHWVHVLVDDNAESSGSWGEAIIEGQSSSNRSNAPKQSRARETQSPDFQRQTFPRAGTAEHPNLSPITETASLQPPSSPFVDVPASDMVPALLSTALGNSDGLKGLHADVAKMTVKQVNLALKALGLSIGKKKHQEKIKRAQEELQSRMKALLPPGCPSGPPSGPPPGPPGHPSPSGPPVPPSRPGLPVPPAILPAQAELREEHFFPAAARAAMKDSIDSCLRPHVIVPEGPMVNNVWVVSTYFSYTMTNFYKLTFLEWDHMQLHAFLVSVKLHKLAAAVKDSKCTINGANYQTVITSPGLETKYPEDSIMLAEFNVFDVALLTCRSIEVKLPKTNEVPRDPAGLLRLVVIGLLG
jgi:hypothetical protein